MSTDKFNHPGSARVFDANEMRDRIPDVARAAHELTRLNAGQSRRPVHHRLRDYCTYSRQLLSAYTAQSELIRMLISRVEELEGALAENAGKRWTAEADEALVELASADHPPTMVALAGQFGRSPGAVSARLSELVGMRRITGEQYLRIRGSLDGQEVDGVFVGTTERVDR